MFFIIQGSKHVVAMYLRTNGIPALSPDPIGEDYISVFHIRKTAFYDPIIVQPPAFFCNIVTLFPFDSYVIDCPFCLFLVNYIKISAYERSCVLSMKSISLKARTRRLIALGLSVTLGFAGPAVSVPLRVQAAETSPAVTAEADSSDTVGAAVWSSVKNGLQGIRYLDSTMIADLLAPTRYTSAEKLNKKTEIFQRDGIPFAEITDAMAEAELKKDNLQVLSYDLVFDEVQADLESLMPHLVRNSFGPMTGQAQYFSNLINNNKEKFLLGLCYLYRLYDFSVGDVNIKDTLLTDPSYFGYDLDLINWLITIGSSGGDSMKLSNNLTSFSRFFPGKVTDHTTLTGFLESILSREGIRDANQWFTDTSKALIKEQASAENPDAVISLYTKLKSDSLLSAYILPLLNVSEHTVYVISNPASITLGLTDSYVDRSLKTSDPAAYQQELATFETEITRVAAAQGDFLDLWYRLAREEDRKELESSRLVLDCLRIRQGTGGTASREWSAKFGTTASLGVRELITPMNLYSTFTQANAQAEGTGIRYFMAKAASNDGLSTYTHELTHLLEDTVWMNNQPVREGLDVEFYPRGLYETFYGTDTVMNLNFVYDYSQTPGRLYNKTAARFQTTEDLQEYTQGMLDVIYTLDYLEAQAVLDKTTAEKQKWYHKFEQKADTRTRFNQGNASATHTIDAIRTLTTEEAAGLTSWEDLVEQNIVASRYEIDGLLTTGQAASNGYYTIPLFTANYSAHANTNGVSGDITTRRQAYELLAEYGYYEGMVPYISNQYLSAAAAEGKILSDTYIFGKLFGEDYASVTDFKKAMFQKRIDGLAQLRPITITYNGASVSIASAEELLQLMEEAVAYDLEHVTLTNYGWNNIRAENTRVEILKKAVYSAFLELTDDFTASIYQEPDQPGGGGSEEPDQPGGGSEEPDQPGGGSEEPDQPGGGSEEPEQPGGGSEEPDQPGGGNEEPDQPGGGNEEPDQPAEKPWIFTDVDPVPGDWKYDNIQYVYQLGLMADVGNSKQFLPNNTLTRGMFVTVLYRMSASPAISYTPRFSDVPDDTWYTNAILWASQNKLADGYSNNSFGVNDPITREQIAKILFLYGQSCGYPVSGRASLDHFTDPDAVSPWATEYIQWAVEAGMISGKPNTDGSFRLDPKGKATRAECAKMLTMFLKNIAVSASNTP